MAQGPVRCREILEADIARVRALLRKFFPLKPIAYWDRAFERLAARAAPAGCPRYGYLLDHDGTTVGALLLIFASIECGPERFIRCNVSSWCVEPAFSMHASLLAYASSRNRKDMTFVNVSPAAHTQRMLTAYGYQLYSRGQYLCMPALCPSAADARVHRFRLSGGILSMSPAEADLLATHSGYGWTMLVCQHGDEVHGFGFIPRKKRIGPLTIRYVQLGYCRNLDHFRRFAGVLGRALLRGGWLYTLVDCNEPLKGIPGRYFQDRAPKYFKGPHEPEPGDLSFTEAALFGFD